MKSTAKERAVAAIEEAILHGECLPGDRLVERAWAERLAISAIPVREALRELEMRGLVASKANCGCRVAELDAAAMAQVSEVRLAVEPQMMAWAARRRCEEDLEASKQALGKMEAAAKRRRLADYFWADLEFHRALWEAAGNPFGARALEGMLGAYFASGLARLHQGKGLDLGAEAAKHRELWEAVAQRDGKRARKLTEAIAGNFQEMVANKDEA